MRATVVFVVSCVIKGISALIRISHPVVAMVARLWRLAVFQSSVSHAVPLTTQFDGKITVVGTGNIILGQHCRFGDGVLLETKGEGKIVLGDNVRINKGCVLTARTEIMIGNDTLMGEYSSIRDANHCIKKSFLIREQGHVADKITIGQDVWIGRGTIVLKGVSIGEGAVVGANSTVNHSIKAQSINVGAPSRLLKYRE